MRLVQNDRVDGWQKIANRIVAKRKVCHEQVVIDDDYVGGLSVAPCLVYKTLGKARTLGAQTVVTRRSDQRPDRGVFRHRCQFGAIASRRGRGEAHDRAQVPYILARRQQAFILGARHPMQTHIIGAALQQSGCGVDAQCIEYRRQVLAKQLILQRLGARRKQYLAAGEQRRDQIGERLAGTRAGFCDQRTAGVDRVVDRGRHVSLRSTGNKAVNAVGQRSVLGERRDDSCSDGLLRAQRDRC